MASVRRAQGRTLRRAIRALLDRFVLMELQRLARLQNLVQWDSSLWVSALQDPGATQHRVIHVLRDLTAAMARRPRAGQRLTVRMVKRSMDPVHRAQV